MIMSVTLHIIPSWSARDIPEVPIGPAKGTKVKDFMHRYSLVSTSLVDFHQKRVICLYMGNGRGILRDCLEYIDVNGG